ncbi:MAG TPA: hypothetical protein VKP30_33245, partial [Polyangiaceae bacterium]|nr:hypothetical protein [Polyangiaceae bacterium]
MTDLESISSDPVTPRLISDAENPQRESTAQPALNLPGFRNFQWRGMKSVLAALGFGALAVLG